MRSILRQIAIGAGDLGAAVDQEDDLSRAFERDAGLVQNFAGDQLVVVVDDAAGIDQLEGAAAILALAVDPVARDAGLIADNRAALSAGSR